ncbi:hypothetical protein NHX12_001593 [Muraenolepis orangiensis]|uniref:Uncharacterized protein n=1 Tax=Muraenolepis orangiensis TaxID=630683 RepID=A0A9Q0E105_9TELE|nr:hypothetical protein NHX12_001593 [Muraenolepis orangiensis]
MLLILSYLTLSDASRGTGTCALWGRPAPGHLQPSVLLHGPCFSQGPGAAVSKESFCRFHDPLVLSPLATGVTALLWSMRPPIPKKQEILLYQEAGLKTSTENQEHNLYLPHHG